MRVQRLVVYAILILTLMIWVEGGAKASGQINRVSTPSTVYIDESFSVTAWVYNTESWGQEFYISVVIHDGDGNYIERDGYMAEMTLSRHYFYVNGGETYKEKVSCRVFDDDENIPDRGDMLVRVFQKGSNFADDFERRDVRIKERPFDWLFAGCCVAIVIAVIFAFVYHRKSTKEKEKQREIAHQQSISKLDQSQAYGTSIKPKRSQIKGPPNIGDMLNDQLGQCVDCKTIDPFKSIMLNGAGECTVCHTRYYVKWDIRTHELQSVVAVKQGENWKVGKEARRKHSLDYWKTYLGHDTSKEEASTEEEPRQSQPNEEATPIILNYQLGKCVLCGASESFTPAVGKHTASCTLCGTRYIVRYQDRDVRDITVIKKGDELKTSKEYRPRKRLSEWKDLIENTWGEDEGTS